MPLNKQKGNMYGFVSHTFNPIKGICPHQCSYCYMRSKWPRMKEPRLDEKELKVNPGEGKFIFVGSSIDMWAEKIYQEWINSILNYLPYWNNRYLFQSKNPYRFMFFLRRLPKDSVLCTTIETNRIYQAGVAPVPKERYIDFHDLRFDKKMVTIEPIMDFDIDIMIRWIADINPIQINVGADSGGNHLPEPSRDKLLDFLAALKRLGFNVYLKPNLNRLVK